MEEVVFLIFFWNWSEVYVGVSIQKFNEIRNLLRSQDIRYQTKTRDSSARKQGLGRRRRGSVGENRKFSKTYAIYVHRRDVERVMQQLR